MSRSELLDDLVVEHDRIGSPLRYRLGPGVPRSRVESTLTELGLQAPDEVIELFGWHETRDAPGDRSRVEWFWPAAPLRLDEAVEVYRRSLDLSEGGITRAAFDELLRTHDPNSEFTGFWRIDWLPILYAAPEQYAIECGPEPGRTAGRPIWLVNWHPDHAFPTMQVAPSLTSFVERVVELLRLDAYAWSPEYQSLVTVDEVFEREGIGYAGRPWSSAPI